MVKRVSLALGRGGFLCGGSMYRLTSLTPAEKKFLDDAISEAERISGKKLSRPQKHIVLNQAREQIEGQRYASQRSTEREQERHAVEFTWSKPKPFRR